MSKDKKNYIIEPRGSEFASGMHMVNNEAQYRPTFPTVGDDGFEDGPEDDENDYLGPLDLSPYDWRMGGIDEDEANTRLFGGESIMDLPVDLPPINKGSSSYSFFKNADGKIEEREVDVYDPKVDTLVRDMGVNKHVIDYRDVKIEDGKIISPESLVLLWPSSDPEHHLFVGFLEGRYIVSAGSESDNGEYDPTVVAQATFIKLKKAGFKSEGKLHVNSDQKDFLNKHLMKFDTDYLYVFSCSQMPHLGELGEGDPIVCRSKSSEGVGEGLGEKGTGSGSEGDTPTDDSSGSESSFCDRNPDLCSEEGVYQEEVEGEESDAYLIGCSDCRVEDEVDDNYIANDKIGSSILNLYKAMIVLGMNIAAKRIIKVADESDLLTDVSSRDTLVRSKFNEASLNEFAERFDGGDKIRDLVLNDHVKITGDREVAKTLYSIGYSVGMHPLSEEQQAWGCRELARSFCW